MKPLLFDKSNSNEKTTLVEDKKLITEDKHNAEPLNLFFCNAVKNFKTTEFSDTNPQIENNSHPIFGLVLKYKNHPGILAIKNTKS